MELKNSGCMATSESFPWRKPLVSLENPEKYILLPPSEKNSECPAGVDIHAFVYTLANGYISKAIAMMRRWNPFPVICDNLCHYHCESTIVRDLSQSHSAVHKIKDFVSKYEISGHCPVPKPYQQRYPQKVVIVGASLEGLTVALDLCRIGYNTTIFEEREKAGGRLRNVVPPPLHEILDKEILFIQESGVKIFTNKKIKVLKPFLEEYDVIVLASGLSSAELWKQCDVDIPSGKEGLTNLEKVFAVGDLCHPGIPIPDVVGKAHDIADQIHAYLQKFPVTQKRQFLLPVLRQYETGCPYVGKKKSGTEKPEEITKVANAVKCANCGLRKSETLEAFSGEGCLNCAQCETCMASCNFKQVLVKTQSSSFLAQTTKEIAKKVRQSGKMEVKCSECSEQSSASQASDSKDVLTILDMTPQVDSEKCVSCGRCEEVCPYRAITISFRKGTYPVAMIDFDACRSCSLCVGSCPTGAISQEMFSQESLNLKSYEQNATVLSCRWSGLFGDFQQEPSILKLMCTRYATPRLLLNSIIRGVRRMAVISCHNENCHYMGTCNEVKQRVQKCNDLIKQTGLSEKIFSHHSAAGEKGLSDYLAGVLQEIPSSHWPLRDLRKENSAITIGNALYALQCMETCSDSLEMDKTNSSESALVIGSISFLEQLLEMEDIAERGTFLESSRILLHLGQRKASLLPALSGLDIPNICSAQSPNLKAIALQNLQKIVAENVYSDMIALSPELYENLKSCENLKHIPVIPLPAVLQKTLTFKPQNLRIGLHLPCGHSHYTRNLLAESQATQISAMTSERTQESQEFCDESIALLKEVPNLDIVIFPDSCGHSFWRVHHKSQREVAYQLFHKAEEAKVEILVSLSPYCSSHLAFITRKGAWKETNIEVVDLYSFLVRCLA